MQLHKYLKIWNSKYYFCTAQRDSSQTLCDGTEQALAQSVFALYSSIPPPAVLSPRFHLPTLFVVFGLWPYPEAWDHCQIWCLYNSFGCFPMQKQCWVNTSSWSRHGASSRAKRFTRAGHVSGSREAVYTWRVRGMQKMMPWHADNTDWLTAPQEHTQFWAPQYLALYCNIKGRRQEEKKYFMSFRPPQEKAFAERSNQYLF